MDTLHQVTANTQLIITAHRIAAITNITTAENTGIALVVVIVAAIATTIAAPTILTTTVDTIGTSLAVAKRQLHDLPTPQLQLYIQHIAHDLHSHRYQPIIRYQRTSHQ